MSKQQITCPGCDNPCGKADSKDHDALLAVLRRHVSSCTRLEALEAWASRQLGVSLN